MKISYTFGGRTINICQLSRSRWFEKTNFRIKPKQGFRRASLLIFENKVKVVLNVFKKSL